MTASTLDHLATATNRVRRGRRLRLTVAAIATCLVALGVSSQPAAAEVYRRRVSCSPGAHIFSGYSPSHHDLQNPVAWLSYRTQLYQYGNGDGYAARVGFEVSGRQYYWILQRCTQLGW